MENCEELISKQAAISHFQRIVESCSLYGDYNQGFIDGIEFCSNFLGCLPSEQPERLTDCDFETIRIHMNAYKEKLCNQQRWKEAEEYQRIIDRFMAFASAQPERKEWLPLRLWLVRWALQMGDDEQNQGNG